MPLPEVDTALFTVPVPIVSHQSSLKAIFPAANRPEQPQSARLLSRALFPSGRDGTSAGEMQSALSDFHLLLFLYRRVNDMGPLLESIRKGTPMPSYYKIALEELAFPTSSAEWPS